MSGTRSRGLMDFGTGPDSITFAAKRRMFGANGAFGNASTGSPLPSAGRARSGTMGSSVTAAPRFAQGTKFAIPGATLARSTYPFPATIPTDIVRDTMKRNWAFGIGHTSNGRTVVVHLERLNQILREDWEKYCEYFDNLAQQRDDADNALNAVGIGRKRPMTNLSGIDGEETPGGEVTGGGGPGRSGYGLYDMANVEKYVRFLGYIDPSDEATPENYNSYNGSLENIPITHAGLVHNVINVFGEYVQVGDKLSFYVGRVNMINPNSKIGGVREFGPIQVIPICCRSKTNSYASVGKLDLFWAQYVTRAYDQHDRRILPSDIQAHNPLVARIGSSQDVFSAANPPRSIAQGDTPCDAVHYEPRIESFEHEGADPTNPALTKAVLITPRVRDCIVFPVGFVHAVPRVSAKGMDKETRERFLDDPTGSLVGNNIAASTTIDLFVHLVR